MTEKQFEKLSTDLRRLASEIPLHWGAVQNNRTDNQINMFELSSYDELITAISHLPKPDQDYLKRRWFLWRCSKCDEYLFCQEGKGILNPNPRDKTYDVEFLGDENLRFDIKGTIIPAGMRKDIDTLLQDPQPIVDFYYSKQSKGVRYDIQNRLFIVHHSFVQPEREFYLRCAWQSKQKIYNEYIKRLEDGKDSFFSYKNVKADVIYILERERNKIESIIF